MEIVENGTYRFVPNGLDEMEIDVNVSGSGDVPNLDITKISHFRISGLEFLDIVPAVLSEVPSHYGAILQKKGTTDVQIVYNGSDTARTFIMGEVWVGMTFYCGEPTIGCLNSDEQSVVGYKGPSLPGVYYEMGSIGGTSPITCNVIQNYVVSN